MGKDLKGKELGEGICQRKNGSYQARYTDRFGNRKTISGRNLKEVKKRFNEAVYENEQRINIKEDICLDEWYSKWMSVYKYNVIRENTKRHYNQVYRHHISPYIGRYLLKDITQLKIREIIKDLDERGYQYETKNKVKILLTDIFNKAMIDDLVRKNPARGITVKKDEEKDIIVLSKEDQIAFFDCCKGTFYDNFFNVAVTTGMRIGELAALRWKDVDLDKKVIHVRRTLVYQKYESDTGKTFHFEDPKTYTSTRDIPINRQCEIALKKQFMQKNVIERKRPKKVEKQFADLLFTTRYNTPLNSQIVCDAIKDITDEINLVRDFIEELEPFSCHCFRHTFATRCFEAGIKPKTVQSYLGHASLEMTMDLYTAVLPQYKTEEMDKLENALDALEESADEMVDNKFDLLQKSANNVVDIGARMVINQ